MEECLIAYCRAGFEGECAAELQARAGLQGLAGYARAKPGSGYVVFILYEAGMAARFVQQTGALDLIFPRQLFISPGLLQNLPVTDRITPLVAALESQANRFSALWVETADTNEAKELLTFCRKFSTPLRKTLEQRGKLDDQNPSAPRAHVFFLSSVAAYPGVSFPHRSSPWFMGIPRLKHPASAPSRATLKLEEAWQVFLTPEQRRKWLQPGMRAVDLGAAPGGWSWQLVRRGIRVIAVDNGAIAPSLLESGLVDHQPMDAFHYTPRHFADWMVCDIVEKPRRVAQLAAQWLANGWCRQCIFNLKLPMKKRYQEIQQCARLITERLETAGMAWDLTFKQLYHDREEVTGYLRLK
ncbi:23S rRNA (cytidine(2498)-2'-O)-methyltransferase RlmM [Nitrosococcus watsonii]|uniref:Ribosomal RNA large subunit methyltransferase M n=1 Tax=Nitrosococcus watsoni (strain C-113) TaxID=105559 RepID=D8K6A5_NITWC|nr:23S rRNA (cytidine(2498)-2'-O)-methyltransferase RlmM [Nitrosococcus watsonii]ADJ28432.1 ribosomal RNA methyltransferase RrmJ/FtsJ [Nitrosococcus watsonii C-113]